MTAASSGGRSAGAAARATETDEPALSFRREWGDFEGEVRIMVDVGRILFNQNRWDEGIERLRPVMERWERDPLASAAAARFHLALANLYCHAGRRGEDQLRLLDRAAELG